MRYKKSIIIITILSLLIMLPPIMYPPIAANAQVQNQQLQPQSFGERNLRCDFWGDIGNAIVSGLRGIGTWIWDAAVSGIGWALTGVLDVLGVTPMLDGCLTGQNDMNDLNGDIQLDLPPSADDPGWPAGTSVAVKINNWMWHLVYALLAIILFAIFVGRILPGLREKTKGKIGSIVVALILTPATLYICKLIIGFNAALCAAFTDYFLVTGSYGSAGEAIVKGLIAPSIAAGMVTIIIPLIVILLLIIWLVILYFRHIIIVFSVALMPVMPILLCFDSTSGFAKKFITIFVEWVFLLFFYDVIIVFAIAAEAQTFWGPFNAIGFLAFMCIMPKMYFSSTSAVSRAVSGAVRTAAIAGAAAGGAAVGTMAMSPALAGGKLAGKGIARGVRGAKDAVSRKISGARAGKAVRTGKVAPTGGPLANNERAFASKLKKWEDLKERVKTGDKTAKPELKKMDKEFKIMGEAEAKRVSQRKQRDDKENRVTQRDHKKGVSHYKNKKDRDEFVKEQKQTSSSVKKSQGRIDRHGLTKKENEKWTDLKNKPRNNEEQREFDELNKKRDHYDTGGGKTKDMEKIHNLRQQEYSLPQKEKDYNTYAGHYSKHLDDNLSDKLKNTDMKEQIALAKNERKAGMKTYDDKDLPSGLNEEERNHGKRLNKPGRGNERTIEHARTTSKYNLPSPTGKEIIKENRQFLKGLDKEKLCVLKGPEERLKEQYKEMKKQQPGAKQKTGAFFRLMGEHKELVKKYAPPPKKRRGAMSVAAMMIGPFG